MKKIFGFAAVVAMVAAANVKMASNNNEELTALQLENIEALADIEITIGRICNNNICSICYWGPTSIDPNPFMMVGQFIN